MKTSLRSLGRAASALVLLLTLSVGLWPGTANAITQGPWNITSQVTFPGRCLDVRDGSAAPGALVQVYTCLREHYNQRWQFTLVPNSGNYYQIKAMHSGLCLDVIGGDKRDGAGLNQWDCHMDWANQQWRIQSGQLISKNSGKCADVLGGSTANGARVIQWSCYPDAYLNHPNQLWSFQAPF